VSAMKKEINELNC